VREARRGGPEVQHRQDGGPVGVGSDHVDDQPVRLARRATGLPRCCRRAGGLARPKETVALIAERPQVGRVPGVALLSGLRVAAAGGTAD